MPVVKKFIPELWKQEEPPEATFDVPLLAPNDNAAAAAAPATEETPAAVQAALGHWSDEEAPTEAAAPVAEVVAPVDAAAASVAPVEEIVAPDAAVDAAPVADQQAAQVMALTAEQSASAGAPSKDELEKEQQLVTPALTEGPNADQAQTAYQKIAELRDENPEVARRLTPELVAMLVEGVADSSNHADRGNGAAVGADQVAAAAETILYMPGDAYETLNAALGQAGLKVEGEADTGEAAGAERALMLAALAEKHDAMLAGGTQAEKAIAELTQLESKLGGKELPSTDEVSTPIDVQLGQGNSDNNGAIA